jgi:hypothetical protein
MYHLKNIKYIDNLKKIKYKDPKIAMTKNKNSCFKKFDLKFISQVIIH